MMMPTGMMMSQLIAAVIVVTNFVIVLAKQHKQQYPLVLMFVD
jgi:hypothetical protein